MRAYIIFTLTFLYFIFGMYSLKNTSKIAQTKDFFQITPKILKTQKPTQKKSSKRAFQRKTKSEILPLEFTIQKKDIQDIKNFYNSDHEFAKRLNLDLLKADYLAPIQNSLKNKKSLRKDKKRTFLKGMHHLTACAFVYAITGNKEFGEAVKDFILFTCKSPSWERKTPSNNFAPFKESFALRKIAISYDLIYPLFSQKEKSIIANAILNKGIKTLRKKLQKSWNSNAGYKYVPGYLQASNQAVVYLGALYLGTKIMYQHTKKQKFKEEYINAARITQAFIDNYFTKEGGASAATGYYLMTLRAISGEIESMARDLGLTVKEFMPKKVQNPYKFALYLRSNASLSKVSINNQFLMSFGDSRYDPILYNPITKKPNADNRRALQSWTSMLEDPELLWIYQRYIENAKFPSLGLQSSETFISDYRLAKLKEKIKPIEPKIDKEKFFPEAGFVFWRDGFQKDDKVFALVKRTTKVGDHLHSDQNVIQLEAYGERYLADLGVNYYKPKYNLDKSFNNNQITINGLSNSDGTNYKPITPYFTNETMNFVSSDASFNFAIKPNFYKMRPGSIADSAKIAERSIIYLKPDIYIVADNILLSEKADISSHFISECKISSKKQWATYKGKYSKMFHGVFSKTPISSNLEDVANQDGQNMYKISITTKEKTSKFQSLHVFKPTKDRRKPKTSFKSNDTASLLTLKLSSKKQILILQKDPEISMAKINNFSSDADLTVLFYRNRKLTNIFLLRGSKLIVANKDIFIADKKISIYMALGNSSVYGDVKAERSTSFSIQYAPNKTYKFMSTYPGLNKHYKFSSLYK